MRIITLDFETYFDDEYSLSKMTTEAYVRDPRFEVLGFAYSVNGSNPKWYGNDRRKKYDAQWNVEHESDEIRTVLQRADWSNTAVLCHHAQFDGLILSHHYGIKPHVWLDTLSMARLVLGNHISVGLDSLSRHFNLAAKSVPYSAFKGYRWSALSSHIQQLVSVGACHDVELTWTIFNELAKTFPADEYPIVDMTVRMFTEPEFIGDVNLLAKVWQDEQERKDGLLDQLGIGVDRLQSADSFVALLAEHGVQVEYKDGKNGPIPAIAKTDQQMKDLLDEESIAGDLVRARLGVRSTIDQTRAERLGFMAGRGPMCVYLNYAGAHTTRWSGGDKVNWQNFRRGGEIRKAVRAPAGYSIIKADKSQIECRLLNMIAGQEDVIERFRLREDPYIGIASKFYNRQITRSDAAERGVGKQLELSCGYGAGAETIIATAKRGTYGPPVFLSGPDGVAARDLYRGTHTAVVKLWNESDWTLGQMTAGRSVDWRGVIRVEGTTAYLPNGSMLHYPELQWDREIANKFGNSGGLKYKTRRGWKLYGIWGGFLVENFIQALSCLDMKQTCLRIFQASGLRPKLLEHDAGAWLVPTVEVDKYANLIQTEMTRAPAWLPSIPLDCEISVKEHYS